MGFENFPYTNFHELNLDWIAKIAKDFLEQYTHIQELIANGEQSLQDLTASGLEDLQEKADALEQLLQEWYNTHSEDIANQLAEAIEDFATAATNKTNELISHIPADYTAIFNGLAPTFDSAQSYNINDIVWYNDRVYRFTRTHAAGEWTGTDAVVSSIGDILTRYVSAVSPNNDTAGYTDCDTFPTNKIIVCLTAATAPAHAPYTGFRGVFLTLSNQSPLAAGCQIAVSTENEMFFRYGDNVHGYSQWITIATNNTIGNTIISAFDSAQSYNINDIVWYNDRVYRFTRTHAAGEWTGTDATVSSVGDILKRYLSAVSPDNDTAGYTDCDTFPTNKIIVCLTSATSPAHAPYGGYKGVFLTLSNQSPLAIGCQISVSTENKMFFRYGDNVHGYSQWMTVAANNTIENILGVVGVWTGNLSGQTNTQILMEANKTYIIKRNKPFAYRINVFGIDNTDNYKKWFPYQDFIRFTNDSTARYLVLYDIGAHAEEFDITVYEDNSPALSWSKQTEYYTVNKDSRDGDFTSITECFLALKDNTNPKVIYIDGGDYDIFQEYADAGVPVYTGNNPTFDFFDYCVWTPANSHIIGRGIVKMIWKPNASDITYNQSHTCSPLNVANNCFIENIEVHCKNGRYCLHNDTMGMQQYNDKIQHFKNIKFYKENGDMVDGRRLGKSSTIGFGIDAEQKIIFENCEFYNNDNARAFYGHSRADTAGAQLVTSESGSIDIINCIISSAEGAACMRLGCSTNNQLRIPVKIANTYFSGQIRVTSEPESTTPAQQNNFDLTLLNCSDVSIYYADPNNPYPAKVYHM